MGETSGTTRTSSRDPLRRAALRHCRRRRRRYSGTPTTREKESHPRNEAASISSGYPGFRNRFLGRTRAGWATHVAPVPRTAESAGESGWLGRRIERSRIERECARPKGEEAKGDKKERRRRETREWRRESGMGFMPCSMTKSFQNKCTFVKNIFRRKKCN